MLALISTLLIGRLTKFLHLLINIAATLTLGMSNTYQQLVTSLRFDEIKWVLSKHGDSRVGTNSPTNINYKKRGKCKAWLSWTLLVVTSIVGTSINMQAGGLLNDVTYSRFIYSRILFLDNQYS